jgi:hypothetical protein
VPHRLTVAVPLAAVLLAASKVTGCSTATRPAAPSVTSAPATRVARAAPTTTLATSAPGLATNQGPEAAGAAGSQSARYVFPVRGCRASYGHSHSNYPATDIFTDRGCAFVAATDGTVDEVNRVDRWDPASDRGADRGGLSVSIIGIDGVRYYGSHLQSIAPGITHGARVHASQLLGRIDNSGSARTTPTMSTSACPGRPHRASGGSAAAWSIPGRTWMPGARVASSLPLRRSRPPTPTLATTSRPVVSVARPCGSPGRGLKCR